MNDTAHDPAPQPYLENGPGQVFLLVFLSVQGTVGNLLILTAVAREKRLQTFTGAFIVNVAVMDLMVTALIMPSMVPLLLAGRNVYPHALCQVIALMTIGLVSSSLCSLAAVAINRYVYVIHQAHYTRVYSRGRVGVMLAVCWLYGLALALPTLFGWGGLGYFPVFALCCYDYTASLSHLIFISVVAICVPGGVTFSAYGAIMLTLHRSKKRVAAHQQGGSITAGATTDNKSSTKQNNGDSEQTSSSSKNTQLRTTFIISSLFSFFWCPYSAVCLLEHAITVPPVYLRAAGWLGLANSCANSVILALVNKHYRAAFRRILCCGRGAQNAHVPAHATRTQHQ